ncbi:hypothetical protein Fot_35560 [Forsythia ovata]|uniref:Uncharacterized protein n=1 Tax=Forsythia ovata TaxID=205694 RepID=A0ABD1SPW6_9LAMI
MDAATLAAGGGSFPKTVASSSSRRDPMLIYSYFLRGRDVGAQNASSLLLAPAFLFSSCLALPGEGTGLAGIDVDGTFDVTLAWVEYRRSYPSSSPASATQWPHDHTSRMVPEVDGRYPPQLPHALS